MVVAAILILCAVCLLVRRQYKRKQTKKQVQEKGKAIGEEQTGSDDAPSTTDTPTEKSKKEAGRDARGNKMSNY
jgi:hypothetical protein